ncbi:radical SAM family heme chaperone HemW [Jeotgalibacillus aurantiacus]|uniref:radical SAM family heme chaperone HemW n=1 Tax=Jeotgalibacillus aurantiacus TaxID=2763266 RepID=UPI001D0AEF1B|nr:radical SAM family heme chaperone HemW [Jeotgalibacillus aurantiacus]
MSSSIYIHIPFCHHICHYCDFNKVFMKGQPVEKYIDMLIREFSMKTNEGHRVKTVFVGGGTPTALTAAQLEQLCEGISRHFQLEEGAEYTFEANPGDLTPDKIQVLKNHGVNRLSFGVQSFNDRLLERIGRGHRSSDVYRSIEDAQKAGITNLSVDLIYALPDQTLEDFEDTLKKAIELDLPHYSGYSLIVEPKTVFYNLMRKGKLPLPGEDAEAAMYELLMKQMEAAGRSQYEISNFALPGFESEHNKVYWKNESYLGLGAGAHGYIDGVRYSNIGPVNKYIQSVEEGNEPVLHSALVTLDEKMEEELFLGLRMSEGVSGDTFLQKYGKEMDQVFSGPIQEMTKRHLLEFDQNRLKLTKEGRFLGNEVFQAFLGIN